MAITLQNLIDNVRQELSSWPESAILADAITTKTDNIRITDTKYRDFIGAKALLQIDDEVLLVIDKPDNTDNIRVIRGYENTTIAKHSKNSTIHIYKPWGWTENVIRNKYIPRSIRWLRPAAWTYAISDTFTWSNGEYEVDLSSLLSSLNINSVSGDKIIKVEVKDSQGKYRPLYSWDHIGPLLRFTSKATADNTLRIKYMRLQPQLAAVTSTLDDDDFEEPIVKYASAEAFNALISDRIKFAEYSASLNDRASSADELIRGAFHLRNQATLAKDAVRKLAPPTYGSTYRDQ